jgi:putative ABC transport system substrate-binding protein
MSYGLNVPALFRRAAELLDKILRGTKPADIPVEQPTTFRLVVNLKTAKALGLTIPESFLLRADTVAGTKCEFRLVRVTTAHEGIAEGIFSILLRPALDDPLRPSAPNHRLSRRGRRASSKRRGLKGPTSTCGGSPLINSATVFPVLAAHVMPICPWPNAYTTSGVRREGPITGSESGTLGRWPIHVVMFWSGTSSRSAGNMRRA